MVTKQNKNSRTIVEKLGLQSDNIISKEEIFHMLSEYRTIY